MREYRTHGSGLRRAHAAAPATDGARCLSERRRRGGEEGWRGFGRASQFLLAIMTAVALLPGALTAQAGDQPLTIQGQVTGQFGEPIPNAEVFISELGLTSLTNAAGRYTLTVPAARVRGQQVQLRVRVLGYRSTDVAVVLSGATLSQDFQLVTDAHRLDEIVVTGALSGTEVAKLGFTVGRVDAADMPVPATNPLSQLQGKVPGALIMSTSGKPGSAPSVLLRGVNAINASGTGRSQEPLYIVDGVPIVGHMPDLNALDIESVEVVKGAAASSLYGAQAGNGVIQITTKSGRRAADGVRFTARSEVGFGDIPADFGIARNHALLLDETGRLFCSGAGCGRVFDYDEVLHRINDVPGNWALNPPPFTIDPGASSSGGFLKQAFQVQKWPGPTYNAVEQFVKVRPFTMNNIDATGRFGGTSFFSSFSHSRETGAIRFLRGNERFSGRLNVDQQVGTNLSIGFRTYVSRSLADGEDQAEGGRAFFRLTRQPPKSNLLDRDSRGVLFVRSNLQNGGVQNENPLYWLENQLREDIRDRFMGGINLRYSPFDWLELDALGSYDGARNTYEQFRDKGFRSTAETAPGTLWQGLIFQGALKQEAYNMNVSAAARRSFGTGLNTLSRVGYSYQQRTTDNRQLTGVDLAAQGVRAGANAGSQSIASARTDIRGISYYGGVVADLYDRYIGDLLIRHDGYSQFGSANRWDTYGRLSLAWRVGEEPWFDVPFIGEFKLRGSYGTAGGLPNFNAQYETFTVSGGVLNFGTMGNRNLRPEKIHEIEFGTDIELFDRLFLQVTRAVSEARDQILPVQVPAAQGFSNQWQNAGTLENKTWEVSLNWPIITTRDFSWSARFNWDRTRTMVTKLNVPPFNIGTDLQATESMFRIEEGVRYGTFFGRKFIKGCGDMPTRLQSACGEGREFQVNDEGYVVWVGQGNSWREGITRNLWNTSTVGPWGVTLHWGMPIILRDEECLDNPNSSCPAQIVELGNALPDYNFSIAQNFSYKRLSAYALVDAQIGARIWNQSRHWAHLDFLAKETDQGGKSVETAKPTGYYFRTAPPDFGGATVGGFYDLLAANSHFVEDGSFIKLRELSISYNVGPISGVGDWQFSVVGRNLFTKTNYMGWDPETGIATGSQSGSAAINRVDAFNFPNPRTITIGISTSF